MTDRDTDQNLRGLGLALFGALVIVPDTLFMRWSGLEAIQMIAWRGLLLSATLLTLWAIRSKDRRGDLAAMAGVAGIGVVLCQATNAALFSWGVGNAPVAVVLFAVATVPLVSALIGALFLDERAGRSTIIAACVVLAGIGLSVSGGGHGSAEGSALVGALCGLAVAVALAASFSIFRARPRLPVFLCVGLGAGLSGVTGLILSESMTATQGYLPAIWVTGLVILPISFTTLNIAPRYTVAANVSLLLLLETVLGPLVVWWGAGEAVGPRGLIGGGIVVATLAVYLWSERRRTLRGS